MPDFAPALETVFDCVPEEGAYPVEAADGEIPRFIRGTYYLIGPARFVRGGLRYRHWLDGDGMVTTLRFGGGEGNRAPDLTNRFVRSTKLVDEEAAGEALYRTFGTAFDGDQLLRGVALASPVNVSACFFTGRFLAFGEQGLPWELDPVTLETRGEHTFGGRLNALAPFAAHPKIDRETGELFNFGVSFSARRPTLTLYRFAADGTQVFRRRHDLDLPRSNHDFGLSERYAAFYLSPHVMDMEALMTRGASVMDALSWQPEKGSRLLVLSREDGSEVASIPIGRGYCLHLANAFDHVDGGNRLTLDLLELEEPVYPDYQELPSLFERVRPGRPVRLVVDLDRGEVVDRREVAYHKACDFPAVARSNETHPTTDTWLLGISTTGREGRKFFDELVHVRWETPEEVAVYRAPEGTYLGGEPVFVENPEAVSASSANGGGDGSASEPRGVIIVQEIDPAARRSAFLLFDAFAVERGPIARLANRSPIPPCFHAGFEPG